MLLLTSSLSAATLLQNNSVLNFNGDAQVGATFLNWLCTQSGAPTAGCGSPATAGNFAVQNSTLTFADPGAGGGANGLNGNFGYIKDISQSGQPIQNVPFATLANFITFVTALNAPLPNLTLDLTEIPEGTNTPSPNCVGINHCTPTNAAYVNSNNTAGLSAFNLDYNSSNKSTTATFTFYGIVHDNVAGDSPNTAGFTGTFSEPILPANCGSGVTDCTPAAVLAQIGSGGTVTSPYGQQGFLTITLVPEPVTLTLVGAGLLGLGVWGRRRQRG